MDWEWYYGPHKEFECEEYWELLDVKNKLNEEYVDYILEKYAPRHSIQETIFIYKYYLRECGVAPFIRQLIIDLLRVYKWKNIIEVRSPFGELIGNVYEQFVDKDISVEIGLRNEIKKIIQYYCENITFYNRKEEYKSNYYDMVVGTFPFVWTGGAKKIAENVITSDGSIYMINKYQHLLNDNGKMIYLIRSDFLRDKQEQKTLDYYEERGLYIEALFEIDETLTLGYQKFKVALVIFSKIKPKMRLFATIHDEQSKNKALESLYDKNYKGYADGYWVPENVKLCDFFNKKYDIQRELKQIFNAEYTRLENYILNIKPVIYFESTSVEYENSIFIPCIFGEDVETDFDRLNPKLLYYWISLSDKIRNDFVALYLNSEVGKKIRKENQICFCNNANVDGLINPELYYGMPILDKVHEYLHEIRQNVILDVQCIKDFIIPCLEDDVIDSILDNYYGLKNAMYGLNIYKDIFSKAPVENQTIKRYLSLLKKENSLEMWNSILPFPLATILRRYMIAKENYEKFENIMYFFEAFSMFIATIFLSALEHGRERIDTRDILKFTNAEFYERSTFGSWNHLNKNLAAYFRKQIKNGNINDVKECFAVVKDINVIEKMCSSKIFNILDNACRYRNEWKGHGGICGNEEYERRIRILQAYLTELQKYTIDIMDSFNLIKPIDCKKNKNVFYNRVMVMRGDNSLFPSETIDMVNDVLDSECSYILWDKGSALELIPLFVIGPSPRNVDNACYFYNRVENNNSTKYVSYHFTDNPEIESNDVSTWNRIKNLF